jgi:hypothetical protein
MTVPKLNKWYHNMPNHWGLFWQLTRDYAALGTYPVKGWI